MRLASFAVLSLVSCDAKELFEVFGPRAEVDGMDPHVPPQISSRAMSRDAATSYWGARTPEHCVFPIDVLIIQDATASLADDWAIMQHDQLPQMIDTLSATHPGSRFAIMTHRDKPIWPLGLPEDYCVLTGAGFSQNQTEILNTYNQTIAYGGADGPECQFTAILAATQLSKYQWHPEHTRLVVVATDAGPHFNLDGFNTMGLAPTNGTYDEANPDHQCRTEYYPSPEHVKSSLSNIEAYLAAVVFDPDYLNGLVARAWQWVIRDLGQTDEFVNLVDRQSNDFWPKLSQIITELESIECVATTTPVPQTSHATVPTRPEWCPPCPTHQCKKI
eukprot:Gregarina_sp_Pseudo_9__1649@NODE_2109_length_1146_cov_9540_155375_g247_i1_p1_GENE_NODE_2109_length_1146_cov_9540_155375_g247_i1NODE_2109_length_1146_cov_9540_155375_g247_i1_p1_ORF_typecomplete_len332_score42_61Integrin_beta/PF00362_18/1e19VWA/PF00092_28/0_00048_NODE_2109_length_1146_cov_9540_155375_g247_i11011096